MRRLDRYVLSIFAGAWLAALLFFVGMYLVIHFFNRITNLSDAAEHFRSYGYEPFPGFCRYYAFNLPFIMVEVMPFAVLMAAMWTFQQMARRNELVPVLVGGVSFRRLSLPLVIFGFLIALGFAAVKEEVLPRIAAERQRMERMLKGKDDDAMRSLPILQDGQGHILLVTEYDVHADTARGVTLRTSGNPAKKGIYAEAVRYDPEGPAGPGWYVVPGTATDGDPTRPLPTDLRPEDIEIESRALLFLAVGDLKRLQARHPERFDLDLLLHGHYAYPLRTVVLLLLGLPLVLRTARRAPYATAGLGLLVAIAFFAVQSVVEELGRRGEYLNPVLGAWLPIIVFGSLGVLRYETMST